ncbi:hypothetical protein BaRGS_00025434 [Batillaria attramentaria]|uniref:RING-type domain-containing protein n=1 Tax=Batillaria attramentaria TaxID=370345 RepID=A0ABD0K863_9CAEN
MSQSSDIGADVTAWQPTDRDDVLCVGDRVLWPRDGGNEYGTVRWIGVLEGDTSNEIHAGVEFDNPVGKGTGKFRDQRLFYTQYGHAALVPLMGLVKLVCDDLEIQQHTQNTRQDDHKAHEVHLNKIRKLSCTICMELFRSPRLLPCHHTFCLECLQKLAAEHKSNRFPCPTCRQHAPVPSDGLESLQINFYLEDDLREAHNAEQGQAGARTSIETVTRHHQEECGATGSQSQHDVLQEISDYKQTIRQHQQQLEHLSGTIAEQEQFMVDFQEQKQRLRQRIRELEKDNKQQKGLLETCVEEKTAASARNPQG